MSENEKLEKLTEVAEEESEDYCKNCDEDCELQGEEDVTYGEIKEIDTPERCPFEEDLIENFEDIMENINKLMSPARQIANLNQLTKEITRTIHPPSFDIDFEPIEARQEKNEWKRHAERKQMWEDFLNNYEEELEQSKKQIKQKNVIIILEAIGLILTISLPILRYFSWI